MSDRHRIALAIAVWLAASLGGHVSASGSWLELALFLAVTGSALVAAGLLVRRPVLVIGGMAAIALVLSGRAANGYQPVVTASEYEGTAVVMGDARTSLFGATAEVRLRDGRRFIAQADFELAGQVEAWGMGEERWVSGTLRPLSPGQARWARSQHLAGRLALTADRPRAQPAWWWQPSEVLRDLVGRAARPLGELGPLYSGLVIGDDRFQPIGQQAEFRQAGLSHLLAVSGQNVAFVLAVMGPVLNLLPGRLRPIAAGLILAVFVVATRAEPSVLRATGTVAVAMIGRMTGRSAGSAGNLALAVTVLVLIDPFLVGVVGFQLSVAASVGLISWSSPLAERLSGPRWLAEAVGVTVAAQCGVLPLLIAYFGPVSLISLPANLLVGWAAGAVMVWGMSVGLVAPLLGGVAPWLPGVVQLPPRLLVGWIDLVAGVAAATPAPRVDWSLFALGAAVFAMRHVRQSDRVGAAAAILGRPLAGRRSLARAAIATLVVVLLVRSWPTRPNEPTTIDGAQYWPAGPGVAATLVLDSRPSTRLAESLLNEWATDVAVVIAPRAGPAQRDVIRSVADVTGAAVILAPGNHRVPGASRVVQALEVQVWDGSGQGSLVVRPSADGLAVTIAAAE